MDTLEITKFVGAGCGALLVFLVAQTAATGIYGHGGGHGAGKYGEAHQNAYVIEVAEAETDTVEEEVVELAFADVYAAADASAGEKLWRACGACHKLEPGANGAGPYLHGVVGRGIGSVDGFSYSGTLAEMGGEWTPEAISGFLENPKDWAPGTKMAYRGMKDIEDRANLIAYLETYQ
ncbi:MAG: c-type cytochrome [Pseudomonadota bacterium]